MKPLGNFHALDDDDAAPSVHVRAVGLGNFHVLDDALLLSVLACLDARDLARMSCCSRACAVYCDHEPLWKDVLLRERGGNWGPWRGTFRDTYSGSAHVPFQVRGLYSDLLNKSWLCATASFNRAWLGVDTVPRERNLSLEDFVRRYELPNRPVVLTGLMDDWPLYRRLAEWTREVHDKPFKVGEHHMTWAAFMDYAASAADEDPLYLFDKHFVRRHPALADMYSTPCYFSEQRDLFSLLPPGERPDHQWLIAGGACSGSSFHIDPNGTSAWNAVLSGAKKWILAPKRTQIPGVYPDAKYGQVATPISATEWFVDFYQQLKDQQTPVLEVVQRAGEIIFVPHGWFHIVLNLEPSVAITHNFVSQVNLYNVMTFLDSSPESVSGVPHSMQHSLGARFRQALREKAPHILAELEQREEQARAPSKWDLARAGPSFSLLG